MEPKILRLFMMYLMIVLNMCVPPGPVTVLATAADKEPGTEARFTDREPVTHTSAKSFREPQASPSVERPREEQVYRMPPEPSTAILLALGLLVLVRRLLTRRW